MFLIKSILYIAGLKLVFALCDQNCVGCRKPAPPTCCPATCPRCLPMSQRVKPVFENSIPRDEDVEIVRRGGKKVIKAGWDHGRLIGYRKSGNARGLNQQIQLLDDRDFYRNDLWENPDNNCAGNNCPCANCVCCFTETILCTVTTTCTSTEFSTFSITNTYTTFDYFSTIKSVTNRIVFTVTNAFYFTTTETTTVNGNLVRTVNLFEESIATTTTTYYFTTVTVQGIVQTIFSSLPGGPTSTSVFEVYITEGVTSIPAYVTNVAIKSLPGSTITTLASITLIQQKLTVTPIINDLLTITATLTTVYVTDVPKIGFPTIFTETATDVSLNTARQCTGIETVRHTPAFTILTTTTPSPDCQVQGGLIRRK